MITFKVPSMLKTAVLAAVLATPFAAHAASPVPCETMLKDMRAKKAGANLTAAAKAKVDELEAKAIERCNADDDKRSDGFLQDAMNLMSK
jgi:hypothetical protein